MVVKRRLYILDPTSPVSARRHRVQDLFFRSDTLSAALMSVGAQTGANVGEWVARPFFRFSSALPILMESKGPRVFYPVPDAFRDLAAGAEAEHKWTKGILYADARWLRSMASHETPKTGRLLVDRHGLVLKELPDGEERVIAVPSLRTGLAVDRWTGGPIEEMLFEVSDVTVCDRSFRLGVVAEIVEERQAEVEQYLRLVGLSGIGGARSQGRGQFEVIGAQDLPEPNLGRGSYLLLSLFHPREEEWMGLDRRRSSYRLESRGGWVTAPGAMSLRRSRVTMLVEGSVLVTGVRPEGSLVEVLSPAKVPGLAHPVYRDGRAVTIETGLAAVVGGAR